MPQVFRGRERAASGLPRRAAPRIRGAPTSRGAAAGSTAPRPRPRRARATAARPRRRRARRSRARASTAARSAAAAARNVAGSWCALKSSTNDSSVTCSPVRLCAGISSPFRKRPTVRSSRSAQFARVILRPSVRNHQLSGSPEPSGDAPVRNCVRWNTGWASRRWISRRVNSRSRCRRSSSSQSNQEISLSWQYALLLPRCVRAELVAAEQHRHALREEERRQEVAHLPVAQRVHGGVVGRPLGAAVPAAVVVGAVAVPLPVRLVVLLVVRDEVGEREAVVGGDEVDRRERPAAVVLVEVARAGEALGELGDRRVPAPEVADAVAVDAVPLRPEDREVADLVAARPDVPRLGDQLDLREHRVLVDRVEERREAVDVVELARERRGEVEPEAVDVAVDHEVAERVHDQAEHARVHRVQRVARPGEVHVVPPVVRHQPVVGGVVDALEAEHRAEVVALGGVVVDDVEDHLDPRAVERLHHPLELAHLLAVPAGRRVERVRREVADRAVAPVVRQAALDEARARRRCGGSAAARPRSRRASGSGRSPPPRRGRRRCRAGRRGRPGGAS